MPCRRRILRPLDHIRHASEFDRKSPHFGVQFIQLTPAQQSQLKAYFTSGLADPVERASG